ncbi:hypothetical protein TIFTF001_033924 [Ficus carica]|uniref:Uncharacterized protein n=1 Tax=Ficus carica TaxID=3494 RepID=A0AA88J8H3_FICCA|nr:hypothetical protein TIFTF001_033924 [Ficus carica]
MVRLFQDRGKGGDGYQGSSLATEIQARDVVDAGELVIGRPRPRGNLPWWVARDGRFSLLDGRSRGGCPSWEDEDREGKEVGVEVTWDLLMSVDQRASGLWIAASPATCSGVGQIRRGSLHRCLAEPPLAVGEWLLGIRDQS